MCPNHESSEGRACTETPDARETGLRSGTGRRTRTRREAAYAMRHAAQRLSVDPSALTAADYQAFRATHREPVFPSALTISALFAGWQRACEQVASLTRDDVAVEAEVVHALYGDRLRRKERLQPGPHVGC